MKFKRPIAIFCALVFCALAWGQVPDSEVELERAITPREKLLGRIEALKDVSLENFTDELNAVSEELRAFEQERQLQCSGEYASIEISASGETRERVNTLSKEEKKLCMLELVKLRQNFAQKLFEARKSNLERQHREQLENLEKARRKTLGELESMATQLK